MGKPLYGTLERGLAILSLYGAHGQLAPLEVAERLALSKSAVYRLIGTLQQHGFLEPVPGSKGYRLGVRSAEIGMAAVAELDIVRAGTPFLRSLTERTAETSFLAVVVDGSVVYVHRENGPQPVTLASRLGSRRPLHSTALGKAYLAAHDPARWSALIAELPMSALTTNTITEPAAMLAELELTARRGYAMDNQEGEPGVGCFAAAVRDHQGAPIGAISLAGPAERVLPNEQAFAPLVTETAARISHRLGYSRVQTEGVR